jgi:hypothetical protein
MDFFYVYGIAEGRPIRSGPFNSEKEAITTGIKLCGSSFEVFRLKTKDSAEAARQIKFQLASRSGTTVHDALQKQRINRPDEASQAYKEIREKEIDGRI